MKSEKSKTKQGTIERALNNKANKLKDKLKKVIDSDKVNEINQSFSPLIYERNNVTRRESHIRKSINTTEKTDRPLKAASLKNTIKTYHLNNLDEEAKTAKENLEKENNASQAKPTKPYSYINKIEIKGKEYHIKGNYETEEDYLERKNKDNDLSTIQKNMIDFDSPEKISNEHCRKIDFSELDINKDRECGEKSKEEVVSKLKSYQIQKYRHLKNYHFSTNPFVRDRASKKIQGWWKKFKVPRKCKAEMIQKIQRAWRGKSKRQSVKELLSKHYDEYNGLCEKLFEVIRKCTWKKYFPLFCFRRREIFNIIIKIKYKQYLRRWKENVINGITKEEIIKKLTKVRKFNGNRIELLRLYFHIWDIKVKHAIKQEEIRKEKEDELNKQAAIIQIIIHMNTLCQSLALKKVSSPLISHLTYKALHVKAKAFYIIKRQIDKRTMIHYINQWRRCISNNIYVSRKKRIRDLILKRLLEHYRKLHMKKYFDKFKKGLISALLIKLKNNNTNVIIPQALNHLKKFGLMKGIESIEEYIYQIRHCKMINHLLQSRKKRNYFNEYRKKSKRLNEVLMFNKIIRKIFISSFRTEQTIFFLKYFNRWKSTAQHKNICLTAFEEFRYLLYSIEKYVKTITINDKNTFINSLRKYVHTNNKKKSLMKIFGNNSHLVKGQDNRIFSYYFRKWAKSNVKSTIKELKAKYINQVVNKHYDMIDSKTLSNTIHEWKEINLLYKTQKEFDKQKRIIEGTTVMEKFKHYKMRQVLVMLGQVRELYMKSKVLSNISHIVVRQRNSLVKSLNIWKQSYMTEKYRTTNKALTHKMHLKQLLTIKGNITQKDMLLHLTQNFTRWYHRVIIKEVKDKNYFLQSLNENISKVQKVIHSIYSRASINMINKTKVSSKNHKLLKIKTYFLKNDLKNICQAWKQWITCFNYYKMLEIKTKQIFQTKANIAANHAHIAKLKTFTYWKLYHLYKYRYTCESLLKAYSHLNKGIVMPILSEGFTSIQVKSQAIAQDRFFIIMFGRSKAITKILKNAAFEKWKVITKKIDMKLFKSKVLAIIKAHEEEVIKKHHFQWVNYSQQYPFWLNKIKHAGETLFKNMLKSHNEPWLILSNHVCLNYKTKHLKVKLLPLYAFRIKQKLIYYYNQWKMYKEYNQFKDYTLKLLLKRQFINNQKSDSLVLNNSLIKWSIVSKCLKPNISGLSLSSAILSEHTYYLKSILLRNIHIRPFLHKWTKQCSVINHNEIKRMNFNKLLMPVLRKVLRIDIKKVYDKWVMVLFKGRDNDFRQKFMRCFINRKHHSNQLIILKQRLYHWNRFCHLIAYNKTQLIQFPIQITKLKQAISHYPKKISFDSLYNYAFSKLKHQRLTTITNKKTSESLTRVLRNAHKKWLMRVDNHTKASNCIRRLIDLTQEIRKVRSTFNLIQLSKMKSMALEINTIKHDKSTIISNYVKGIHYILNQIVIMKKTISLRKRVDHVIKVNQIVALANFKKWERKSNKIQMNDNARIIQSFIKLERQRNHEKIYKVNTLCDSIDSMRLSQKESLFNVFKFNCLQLPTKISRENMINKQILRVFKRKIIIDYQLKTDNFNHWKRQSSLMKKNQAGNTIIMNMRKYSSKKTLDYLKFRKSVLTKRLLILLKANQSILYSHYNKWRSIGYNHLLNDKAILIQSFLQERIKYKKDLRILRRYNGNMYKGLQCLTQIFETNRIFGYQCTFLKRLTFKTKEQHMNYLCNHIPLVIAKYHLNRCLSNWKLNTVIYTRRNIIKIQKWYKKHYSHYKTFKESYINIFFKKYFAKLDMDNNDRLRIINLHWRNQSVKMKMAKPIIHIQKNIKGFMLRTKRLPIIREENREKIKYENKLKRKSVQIKILIKKWDNPLTKYWVKLKTKDINDERKKHLTSIYAKRREDVTKVQLCTFRKWINKTIHLSTNTFAKVIQKYLYPRLKRVLHNKAVNQIIQISSYKIGKKLNLIARLYQFKKLIIQFPYNRLIQGLIKNKKQLITLHELVMKKDNNHRKYMKKRFISLHDHVSYCKLKNSATRIQKAMRKVLLYNANKQKSVYHQKGLSIVNHLFLKKGIHKIFNQSKRMLFIQMNDIITSHVLYIKKVSFDNLLKARLSLHLLGLIQAITNNHQSVLKHYFNQWKKSNIHIKRHSSSRIIQKSFYDFLQRKHHKKTNSILNSILIKTSLKNTSQLRYYYNIMKRTTKMIQLKEHANIIASFVYHFNHNRIARINWIKFLHKIITFNKQLEINQIKSIQKAIIFSNTIVMTQHNKYKQVLSNITKYNQEKKLKRIIHHNILSNLKLNFLKWKTNDYKTNLLNSLNRQFIALGKNYKEALMINNKNSFNKIYKLCSYKIISKIFTLLRKKIFFESSHRFYHKLENHIKLKTLYTYSKVSTLTKKPVTYSFNVKHIPIKPLPPDKKRYFLILTPLFRNYVLKKMSRVNGYTFDKLLQQSIPYHFANHLRKFKQERMIAHKQELVKKLVSFFKRCRVDMIINQQIQIRLQYFMRPIIKRKMMCIMIKTTIMCKAKAKKKVIKKVIGGWKYYVRMIIFKRKKLEEIENNFISTYEDLANELFSEGHPMQSSIPDELNSFYDKMNIRK